MNQREKEPKVLKSYNSFWPSLMTPVPSSQMRSYFSFLNYFFCGKLYFYRSCFDFAP